MDGRPRDLSRVWLATSILGLASGGVLWFLDQPEAADVVWIITTVLALASLLRDVVIGLLRRQPGVDVIALLAMGGSLALEEYLAGAVIALMLASGEALESYADRRAHRELSALLDRAPRVVSRYEDGELVERPVDAVRRGDRLLVKPGAVIPVDGIASTHAVLDESALTGESRPVERAAGDPIRSGAVNAGGAFDLLATTTADESTYAGIVRLVQESERQRAPIVRLADRYAAVFVPITLVIAGIAWVTGDAVRALSVLVVATPCPLLLAVPIAIVSGTSRAAHRGIIVKGGGVLETLARAKVLVLDKTGTLTSGIPEVADIEVFPATEPVWRRRPRRRASPGRLPRPGLAARARHRARAGRASPRPRALLPHRRGGASRIGDRGHGRRPPRGAREIELRVRRGADAGPRS